MNHKGFYSIIIIFFIVLATMSGIGGYKYLKNKQSQDREIATTTITASQTATIIQGVISSIPTHNIKDNTTVNISFIPSYESSLSYYLSIPLDKIFINKKGKLEKVQFTDLTYGASIVVMGGTQKDRPCSECLVQEIDIINPDKIIIEPPIIFGPTEYKGRCGRESGGMGSVFGYLFYPDLNYDLRLIRDNSHSRPYTFVVSKEIIPALNRFDEAAPDSVIIKGITICPKILSFPCVIWGESVKVLSLQGGQPNEKLNFEGRLTYRYSGTITDGFDTDYYFYIRVGDNGDQDKSIWVTTKTKFYFINASEEKELTDLNHFNKISYFESPTSSLNPLLKVSVTKVCDNSDLNLVQKCKYLADEVIIKSNLFKR